MTMHMRFTQRTAIHALALLLAPALCIAQTGSLQGTVHDKDTGEEIVGANIIIAGTKTGASTDIEGKYILKNVAPGKYDLKVSYVGYSSTTVTGVLVKPGEATTLDIALTSASVAAEEVVVTADRRRLLPLRENGRIR